MLLVNLYIYSNQYKVFSLKEEIEGLLENADLLSEAGEASVLSLFWVMIDVGYNSVDVAQPPLYLYV